MKISFNLLKKLLDQEFRMDPTACAEKLLHLGFEVSSLQNFSGCSGVVTAKILEISKHPNADRLQIAKVTDGTETLNVVCGAPNIQPGQIVFWAKVGATLYNGEKVKESAIRGIKSPGMLCSPRELGVGEDHSGIWILFDGVQVGSPIDELLELEDTVLDVEVTPNRPDCLSHIGIARELAASLNLKLPQIEFKIEVNLSLPFFPVEILDGSGCTQYVAKEFKNIAIAPSPLKIQMMLLRCGIRPINNIVDITNLVLLETGHPLHAFDADHLEGNKIIVRRAKENEKMTALDGKIYSLSPQILVIADANRPVAIAGIMGGEETAINHETKRIILESAVFNRTIVRQGRKILGLSSESSYRFERGTNAWNCSTASSKAEWMIHQITKGKISGFSKTLSSDQNSKGVSTSENTPTVVRIRQVEKVLGEKSTQSEIQAAFRRLGIEMESSDEEKIIARNPDWRLDLNSEIDYIEEIVRLKGYEKIVSAGTRINLAFPKEKDKLTVLNRKIRSLLFSFGFYESRNYGLVSRKQAERFVGGERLIELENPLSEDQSILRPALSLELIKNLRQNLSYQKKDIRFFETGTVFESGNGRCIEKSAVAGIACGTVLLSTWKSKDSQAIDFYWIKGVTERILADCEVASIQLVKADSSDRSLAANLLHPLYSLEIFSGIEKNRIGFFGTIHPKVAQETDLPVNTVLFEMDMVEMSRHIPSEKKMTPVSRTPVIQRDCSIWCEETIPWDELLAEVKKTGGKTVEECTLFDLYYDPERLHHKSLSFTLIFRDSEKTLSDEIANELRDKIIENLKKKFNVEMRVK